MSWRLRAWPLAACILLSVQLAACGDDSGTRGPRCGDGLCNATESSETCPRDCPSFCVPGESRCVSNTLLTCRDDGESEESLICAPGQFCTTSGCTESPGPGPDLTPADQGGDVDVGFDTDLGFDLDAGSDSDGAGEDAAADTTPDGAADAGEDVDAGDAAGDVDADVAADADAGDLDADAPNDAATDTDATDVPDANIDTDATTDTAADSG